jgi:hypothetical protein
VIAKGCAHGTDIFRANPAYAHHIAGGIAEPLKGAAGAK